MVDFDTVSNSLSASDTVADCLDDGLNMPSTTLEAETQLSLDIMRREEIRLQTFLHWPTGWDEKLARYGFCSISDDVSGTVRCVFCGLRISDFTSPQEAQLRHWQSARHTCPFLRGDDVSNIPRNARSQVYEKTPPPSSQTILLQPAQPLRAAARVPREEGLENAGRLTSAECTPKAMPGSYDAGSQPGGSHSQLKRSGPDSPVHWQEIVRTARYPRMASYHARLKTLSRWPLLKPSPTELAKAGFFHVRCNPPPTTTSAATSVPRSRPQTFPGECGDSVKCFWCGERIHRWQETDDALLEHARLSPSCLYVRQVLGQQLHDDIVHGVTSSTATVTTTSSGCSRRDDDRRDVTPFPVRPHTTQVPSDTKRLHSSACPASRRLTSSQLDELMQSPPVQTVLQMGFPPQLIRNLLSHNSERLSADTLCTLALQTAEQTGRLSSSVPAERSVLYSGNDESESLTGHGQDYAEQTRLNRFQSCGSRPDLSGRQMASSESLEAGGEGSGRLMCKVCSEAEVRVMFRPCNHLVCCSQCKALFTSCPVCHQIIEDVLVVYLT